MVISGDSLVISGDGVTILVNFATEDTYTGRISVSNGGRPYVWEPGKISLDTMTQSPEQVDLTALPAEYRELWDKARGIIGELMENEKFWEFIAEPSDEGPVRSQLEAFRDGHFTPWSSDQLLTIQSSIGYDWDPLPATVRSYTLGGIMGIRIETQSAPDDPDPVLNIDFTREGDSDDRWRIVIDPDNPAVEIALLGSDPSTPVTEADWSMAAEVLMDRLRFFDSIFPQLVSLGYIEPDNEVIGFVRTCITALDTKPVQIVYKHNPNIQGSIL
jgi:hypothetical protein